MSINEDCIRDVLQYLIQNLNIEFNENNQFKYSKISLQTLIEYFKNAYSKEDIVYSVNLLMQTHYIEGKDKQSKPTPTTVSAVMIYDVTYAGHQFYEAVKPESIWVQTKKVIKQVGTHTLIFIETTAHDIAIEYAKTLIPKNNI